MSALFVVNAGAVFSPRRAGPSADSRKTTGTPPTRSATGPTGSDEGEWMRRARKLANSRASQFRRERGTQPVAPANWRRKRKEKTGDDADDANARGAARGYDDLKPGRREASESEEVEMTATAGDGLWRVDMENLSTEDWKTQWTMTNEEWNLVKKDVKANAKGPSDALSGFEDAGLRRVSPDIAAEMLRIVADKAKQSKTEREELSGLRRDSRVAHLIGTCVAAARRGSESLSPKSTVSAAWALAVIAGERANSAEMEVLADRSSVLIKEMSPRQLADLAWALASCRHASHAVFRAMDVSFATDSAKVRKFSPFDLSTLTWAFAHLGAGGVGFVHGLDVWFANGSVPTDIDASDESAVESLTATAATKAQTFTPHALVATAWGLAVLGGDALRSFSFKTIWAEIGRKGAEFGTDQMSDENNVKYGPWMGKHLNQIHQCVVSVDAAGGCEALGLPALPPSLVTASEDAWQKQRRPPVTSWYQRDVASILAYMGEKHEEEAFCAGYRVDLFVPQWTGTSIPVAIEVDGPSHFARNDQAVKLGQTRLKHRQLANLGFAVVSVPVADWEYLETSEEKVEYLRCGFEAACAARK